MNEPIVEKVMTADRTSIVVAITTIVSVTAVVTKLLDLASAWLKYKTQLLQTPIVPTVTSSKPSVNSSRMVLRFLFGIWPALLCGLSFIAILFWYVWWSHPLTTGAVVNIALSVGGLLGVMVFTVFIVVVRFRMQLSHDCDAERQK